jgi:hypothetical protein
MCGRRPVGRPGSGRVDLDEPGGTALAYQPVLAEGDSGNRDFHSSRTLLGSISSGHALISGRGGAHAPGPRAAGGGQESLRSMGDRLSRCASAELRRIWAERDLHA